MKCHYLSNFAIDLSQVKNHYIKRLNISKHLLASLKNKKENKYVLLALGISNPLGNYSADQHKLGERILEDKTYKIKLVFSLAESILSINPTPEDLVDLIYSSNIPYLKIGIGSEMAMLLRPNEFWVCNVRTIWAHLLIKHKGDLSKANEELKLYRLDDISSEMHYRLWTEIYSEMKNSFDIIYNIVDLWADEQNVDVGNKRFIWIDAVCSELYKHK